MLLEVFVSWKSNEAASEAVKHEQHSHSSASIHSCGGTGKSHKIAHVFMRLNTEESYCVLPMLGFVKRVPLVMLSR